MSKILLLNEVMARSGKSRTTLWRDVRAQRFPAPVRVGANRIGWIEDEVTEWQENLPRAWQPPCRMTSTYDEARRRDGHPRLPAGRDPRGAAMSTVTLPKRGRGVP